MQKATRGTVVLEAKRSCEGKTTSEVLNGPDVLHLSRPCYPLFLCLLLGLTAACPWTVLLPVSLWGVFGTRPCWTRFCHRLASGGEILMKLSTAVRLCSDSNWLGGSGRDIFTCESDGYCCGHLTPSWRFSGPADQVLLYPSRHSTTFPL